ncbi:hypothetical protein E2C01_004763 [Portunus trituberculatus]|uniref:Uncharacterized protein n=1 Tax=Portunus trituberculatus TaxID=210409 RepID=A0A5B7CS79_PORTR|nr:hypothetical protein [Portunus trituberculatus]
MSLDLMTNLGGDKTPVTRVGVEWVILHMVVATAILAQSGRFNHHLLCGSRTMLHFNIMEEPEHSSEGKEDLSSNKK